MEHGKLVAIGTPSELTRQFVKRLDVDLEVDPQKIETALQVFRDSPELVVKPPYQNKETFTLTLSGPKAIPELLSNLVKMDVPVFKLAPQEANLEEVYFAINGGQE
jgi:ABC-type multidrug transport system ATPase subunit